MGIKISSLPNNALPYTGSEKIPLVQSGQTRGGTLSSFVNYLSGALLSDSELRALSGNWQNTYTTYRSNSANYAVKNVTNIFTPVQSFSNGIDFNNLAKIYTLNTTNLVAGYNAGVDAGSNSGTLDSSVIIGQNSGSGFAESGNGSYSVVIGYNSGQGGGKIGGDIANSILIGDSAGFNIVENGGFGTGVVAIGQSAGYSAGTNGGEVSNSIFIGQESGRVMGSYSGLAYNAVVIGNGAGKNSAYLDLGSTAIAYDTILIGHNTGLESAVDGDISNTIALGTAAGIRAGNTGTAINSVMIGPFAGYEAGKDCISSGGVIQSIMIGSNSGYGTGGTGGTVQDSIMIGTGAGFQAGISSNISESIYIGKGSGQNQKAILNTFIGAFTNTTTPSSASLSGCIAIGHGAAPSARNTIALGSSTVPLSVVPGGSLTSSLSGLKVMVNGRYFTIPLLA